MRFPVAVYKVGMKTTVLDPLILQDQINLLVVSLKNWLGLELTIGLILGLGLGPGLGIGLEEGFALNPNPNSISNPNLNRL
jgi:hypothetical protein